MSKKFETKISAKRITPDGEEVLRTVTEDVELIDKGLEGLASIANYESIHSDSCIYCSSREQLSNEHVIPFAWGGTVQIHHGSCEACRLITSDFENYALNDGAMAHVRKALELPSRSKHKSARQSLGMALTDKDGQHVVLPEAVVPPIILGFPLFVRPGLLVGDGERTTLDMEGIAAAAFGDDVAAFLREHSASGATQRESPKRAMALARTFAKIAYGWAWRDGVVQRLGGVDNLVDAFMNNPARLGAHVGTKPPPYERFAGCTLRIEYRLAMPQQLVYMEIQVFADAGAPTYEVVLGGVDCVREWRRIRQSLQPIAPAAPLTITR